MSDEDEGIEQEDFAAMLARAEAGPALEVGEVVRGRVIQIGAETVFVDVHGKGEAMIARAELEDEGGSLTVAVGDEVEATVVSAGDEIRLSHKLLRGVQARHALEAAAASGVPVEGKVSGVTKGGYEVTVAGVRAFCPFSQMDVRRVESPEELIGRVLEFRISRYAEHGRNVVLSRRQLLEEQGVKLAEETWKKIVPGAMLTGTVSSITDFGAFVDLGGVQGLVPRSEISHSRTAQPSDRLQVGAVITVKVLRVDAATGKTSLSLKALEGDPWAAVPGQLRERQVVCGHVVRMLEFGVFVELLPGVDGLLHMTEIPRSRQGAMRDAAASGAELAVMILGIDAEKRRIALALAPEGVEPGALLESTLTVGSVVTGTVERIEEFGVFVRLGPGQLGVIPNGEMGTSPRADHRKDFAPGTEVQAVVLAIEEGGRRIRLSRAKALLQAEQAETQAYQRDASTKGGGFGMTLGEVLNQRRKR